MYLEFKLPSGAGGMAAGYTKMSISKSVDRVCRRLAIELDQKLTVNYRFRVSFKQAKDYTLFALVWQPKNQWHKYTLHKGSISGPVH